MLVFRSKTTEFDNELCYECARGGPDSSCKVVSHTISNSSYIDGFIVFHVLSGSIVYFSCNEFEYFVQILYLFSVFVRIAACFVGFLKFVLKGYVKIIFL